MELIISPLSIELLITCISIQFCKQSFNVACFYRPPTSQLAISDLINTLTPLGPNFCSKLIFLGDFNVNYFGSTSSSLSNHLPSTYQSIHKKIWLYQKADFVAINNCLSSTDWSTILTYDVNHAASTFTNTFMDIIKSHTPTKTVPNSKLPPWLPRSLLSKIKLRRHTYHKASSTNSQDDWSKYRQLCNNITAEIRKSKAQYLDSLVGFGHMSDPCAVIMTPSHYFDQRATLHLPSHADQDKADSLNKAFSNFFTRILLLLASHFP